YHPSLLRAGCSSLSGPSTAMGTIGGSLSVQCRYEEKYKTFTKYWCRQPCLFLWNQIVATRESEEEVRSDHVSIVDHSGDLTFTVTLENLTADDAGKYRCGIATILHEEGLLGFLPDLFFQMIGHELSLGTSLLGVDIDLSTMAGGEADPGPSCQGGNSCQSPCPSYRSLPGSVHFLLLILVKVPLFLTMLSAVLWVNRPQWAVCGKQSRPDEDNNILS
uniref:Ig-like domain-containing protein n=1 Tax=Canis lupus familiaris TaxID=9615 RepID=A0A8C0Q1E5_CANLF